MGRNDRGRDLRPLFCDPYEGGPDPLCSIGHILAYFGAQYLAPVLYDDTDPAIQDLKAPTNPFLDSLNTASEPFIRVGIASNPSQNWLVVRTIVDGPCPSPASPLCGGRAWAAYVSYVHGVVRLCAILAAVSNNVAVFQNCFYWWATLDYINRSYNELISPGGVPSDGIVPVPSQAYPNADQNYTIAGGDSHLGEPKSTDKSAIVIRQAYDQWFKSALP